MRYVRGDKQDFTLVHHDLAPLDFEFERAFQNVSELLALMMVRRHHGVLGDEHLRHHGPLSRNHFA